MFLWLIFNNLDSISENYKVLCLKEEVVKFGLPTHLLTNICLCFFLEINFFVCHDAVVLFTFSILNSQHNPIRVLSQCLLHNFYKNLLRCIQFLATSKLGFNAQRKLKVMDDVWPTPTWNSILHLPYYANEILNV